MSTDPSMNKLLLPQSGLSLVQVGFKKNRHAWWTTNVLLVALLLLGCVSPNYPTLKQTRIRVSWSMTWYWNAAGAGRLTLGERERVNAAYAQYRTALDEALAAAHNDYDAPTPEKLKALAFEVIRVISAIPD